MLLPSLRHLRKQLGLKRTSVAHDQISDDFVERAGDDRVGEDVQYFECLRERVDVTSTQIAHSL